jgi:DNA invertase Pin-like site-specific DNA recombinase
MSRLAGYLRVSFVGTRADRLRSPQEQTDEINEWAEPLQHRVDFLEPELDGKGTNPDRPILRQAVEGVKAGRWEGVVVAYLSRSGRELRLMLDLWEEIEGTGGSVHFAREKLDGSTSAGRMQRNILASVAQYELEERRAGFERSTKGAVEAGIWQRRQTPRGYAKDPQTRRLVIEELQAEEVRRAARDLLAGKPVVRIAEDLAMTPGGIRAMLRNRVYLGELKVRSYVNTEAHPPILQPEIFEAVQAHLKSAPRPGRNPSRSKALLAGLVRCSGCGHVMTRKSARNGYVYQCVKWHSGAQCPAPAGIVTTRLDSYVESIALAELEKLRISARAGDGVTMAKGRLEVTERELAAYLEAVDAAGLGANDAAAGMRSRREAVDQAREQLAGEMAKMPRLPMIEGGAAIWEKLSIPERNDLLRSLLSAVAVRAVGAGKLVPLPERVRVLRYGADVTLPVKRGHQAAGIVSVWPDADGVDVIRVSGAEDALKRAGGVG